MVLRRTKAAGKHLPLTIFLSNEHCREGCMQHKCLSVAATYTQSLCQGPTANRQIDTEEAGPLMV